MGGIETQVSGLVEFQRSQGHDVFVLTLTAGQDLLGVTRFPFNLPKNLLWHPRGKQLAISALELIKPDVVHLHFGAASPFAWDGLKAVCELDMPSVATVHSIWGQLARRLYSLTARGWKVKTVFSSVSRVSSQIVANSLKREVAIVHNGVDLDFWKTKPNPTSIPIEIVSATRFASRKRIRQQIALISKVVAQLGEQSPHFTIAGSGPDFEHVESQIKKLNLEKFVLLTGRLNKVELHALYAKADLFLQLSVLESFGIAACEARAAGLPVISRAGSGVSEFVEHGKTGFLEDSDSEVGKRIVSLTIDQSALTELKENSRNNPPIQNWSHAGSQVAHLYQQAINQE